MELQQSTAHDAGAATSHTAAIGARDTTSEITSELAYDLMHDHLEVMLTLLEHPLDERALLQRFMDGAQPLNLAAARAVLERLMRHGLICFREGAYHATAKRFHQLRQEGMVTFLERYVLPTLTASLNADQGLTPGVGTLFSAFLDLPPDEIRTMRQGPVQALIDAVQEVSERPRTGVVYRFTLMVTATTRLVSEDDGRLPPHELAVRHLQNASLQRSHPTERPEAILLQQDALADTARYLGILDAIHHFTNRFTGRERPGPSTSTYHLTVATHWRTPTAHSRFDEVDPC